jgi:hypothetical protein
MPELFVAFVQMRTCRRSAAVLAAAAITVDSFFSVHRSRRHGPSSCESPDWPMAQRLNMNVLNAVYRTTQNQTDVIGLRHPVELDYNPAGPIRLPVTVAIKQSKEGGG